MKRQRILICGATGFIGRNIAERYAQNDNFDVYGTYCKSEPFSHPRIRMIKADLTNKEKVDQVVSGTDIIIQAAAHTSGSGDIVNKPHIHVTDNALMNSLIFRSAFENHVTHVVFFSCSIMYQSGNVPVAENDFDANEEIYPAYFGAGWTKVYIEKMCEFYSRISSTKYTAIRHSNIYGPHDKFDLEKSHVFGATLTKVLNARDRKISVWGSGEEERDLLYISDLTDFVEMIIARQQLPFELFNVGYGSSISVCDLVKKIISISGTDINIEYDLTKPSIKTKLCLDISKAKQSLGWIPTVSLDEGIRNTIDWYRLNVLKEESS